MALRNPLHQPDASARFAGPDNGPVAPRDIAARTFARRSGFGLFRHSLSPI
jgi:hypothetical protein